MKTFLFTICIVFASCNGQKKTAIESDNNAKTSNTPLTLLMSEQYSGFTDAENLVITDIKTLQTFFSKVNRTRKPGLPVPTIDFSKEIIIVTCSGELTSGSFALIPYVLEETATKRVLSTELETVEKGNETTLITSPFRIYSMPVTVKEVAFNKE